MLREAGDELELAVWVGPRAARSETKGVADGALRLRLAAPPVDGRANAALTVFIAERLGVAPGNVRLARGATTRRKVVRVRGVTLDEARHSLGL